MPLRGSHMGAETTGRKTPQRARLSDISNTTTSFSKHGDENQPSLKVSETQLHKDLATLKKFIAEKEEIIEAQKANLEKLWTNYTLKTKQNEDIIQQNARLFKEVMQARDRVKILQHENAQMAAAHKVYKSELQAKLAKALERADNSQKAGPFTSEKIACDKQATIPNVLTKLAESRARRTVSTYEAPSEHLDCVQDESLEDPSTCRSTLRQQSNLSYKEPSLKAKLRQPESATPSQVKPCINRRESRNHQLRKVSEEDSRNAAIAMPYNSESQLVESFSPPLSKSASQATSDTLCALSADMLEDQISSTSFKLEERPYTESATHFEVDDNFTIKTTDSASIPENISRGRPSRRSVSSISSYKEPPLNTKMRRPS